jgi:hypothetical protein
MEQDFGDKEVRQGSHEGQMRMAHVAKFLGHMGPAHSPSLLRCRWSSSHWIRLDLKPSIKRVPLRVTKESTAETQKHEPGRSKIGGKNSGGELLVWSPSPLMTLPSSPWWRGSIPPLDYGFVAVANCISIFFFIVLAPYELHNMIMAIFVSLLWWIFLWVIYEITIIL